MIGCTAADLRTLGLALSNYAGDHKEYPAASSIDDLASKLEPIYLNVMPRRDTWGNSFRYECWKEDPASPGCDAYAVVSAGADGRFQYPSSRQYQKRATSNLDDDIVYGSSKLPTLSRDGVWAGSNFVQHPDYLPLPE